MKHNIYETKKHTGPEKLFQRFTNSEAILLISILVVIHNVQIILLACG